jgi:hypothetical protein
MVVKVDKNEDLDFCTSITFGEDVCFFTIYDGSDAFLKTGQQYDHFKEVAQMFKNMPFHYGFVDGTCHAEIKDFFDLEEEDGLPQVVAYFPVR